MLVEFEQNRMIRTTHNFELFDKNGCFDAIFEDVFETETVI